MPETHRKQSDGTRSLDFVKELAEDGAGGPRYRNSVFGQSESENFGVTTMKVALNEDLCYHSH